jgi:hypothetical protein
MEYIRYLRGEADKYRQLAEQSEDSRVRKELLDLAAVCEEAATRIEDHQPGG